MNIESVIRWQMRKIIKRLFRIKFQRYILFEIFNIYAEYVD